MQSNLNYSQFNLNLNYFGLIDKYFKLQHILALQTILIYNFLQWTSKKAERKAAERSSTSQCSVFLCLLLKKIFNCHKILFMFDVLGVIYEMPAQLLVALAAA